MLRALLALFLLALPAEAAVFTVTKTADTLDGACNHDCSLREAVDAANSAGGTDVVVVPAGIYVLTRFGDREDGNQTGDLDVTGPLLLVGAGAGSTVLDGNDWDRILDLQAEAEVYGVTVRHGYPFLREGGGIQTGSSPVFLHHVVVRDNRTGSWGGGIYAQGPLTLRDSAVLGNRGNQGGGIRGGDFAVLSLANVTISGNQADYGGGISYPAGRDMTISASTIAFNQARFAGGGLYVIPPSQNTPEDETLVGSILAENIAPEHPDCFGEVSMGGNVIGVPMGCHITGADLVGAEPSPLEARLGPLTASLGPTPVHPLLPLSPARALVPAALCESGDQVGQARSTPCDAGAWEAVEHPVCVPGGSVLCLRDGRFRVTASWRKGGDGGDAQAYPVAEDTGMYWFFSPDNLELTVKVLNGCTTNGRWWVFSSGLTNVGVSLKVEDLATGRTWTHTQPEFQTYAPRLDTNAFRCNASAESRTASGAAAPAPAADILVVTKQEDTFDGSCDHDCSLREALAAAKGSELKVVVVGPGTYELTRKGPFEDGGATGDLDVDAPVVILGAGARRTILDGSQTDRVLHAVGSHPLEVHGVTVQNGWARGTNPQQTAGGGIYAGTLVLVDSMVLSNRADSGGGVWSLDLTARGSTVGHNIGLDGGGMFVATVRLENVTLSNNLGRHGGGMYRVVVTDHSEISNTTVNGNNATVEGGGLYFSPDITCPASHDDDLCPDPPYVRILRSIVAGNTAPSKPDCAYLENEGGWNVLGPGCLAGPTDREAGPLDVRLEVLYENGGPTWTQPPLPDSPALDLGPLHSCPAVDQRGLARPVGNGCDAGAAERRPLCQPNQETLCLGEDERFKVTVEWVVPSDTNPVGGPGKPIQLGADSGAFWFFTPNNLELTVKVLNGCGINDRYWVFLTGLTDVFVRARVEDTVTGRTWTYINPEKTPLQPSLDTDALEVCP